MYTRFTLCLLTTNFLGASQASLCGCSILHGVCYTILHEVLHIRTKAKEHADTKYTQKMSDVMSPCCRLICVSCDITLVVVVFCFKSCRRKLYGANSVHYCVGLYMLCKCLLSYSLFMFPKMLPQCITYADAQTFQSVCRQAHTPVVGAALRRAVIFISSFTQYDMQDGFFFICVDTQRGDDMRCYSVCSLRI